MHGDLATAEKYSKDRLVEDTESQALHANDLATVKLLEGDLEQAKRLFLSAGQVMGNWNTSGGSASEAILVREDTKEWRGDPFEKAMNSIYAGLLCWLEGEYDNARALAKAAMLSDSDSEKQEYKSDFTLLYWMAGRMSRRMGNDSDADEYYEQARTAQKSAVEHGSFGESSNALLENPDFGNVVLFVDVGVGPEKYNDGGSGELARFRPGRSPWPQLDQPGAHARVWLDDREVGRTSVMADLDFQAMTRGGRKMDGILKGKAVFKTGAAIAGGVLLAESLDGGKHAGTNAIIGGSLLALSLLTSASADIRQWHTLPHTVQLAALQASPGTHRLRIEFCDATGAATPGLGQEVAMDVPAKGESVYHFRSIPRYTPRPANEPAGGESRAAPADQEVTR